MCDWEKEKWLKSEVFGQSFLRKKTHFEWQFLPRNSTLSLRPDSIARSTAEKVNPFYLDSRDPFAEGKMKTLYPRWRREKWESEDNGRPWVNWWLTRRHWGGKRSSMRNYFFPNKSTTKFRPGLNREESSSKIDMRFIRGFPFPLGRRQSVLSTSRPMRHCKGERPAGGRGEIHDLRANGTGDGYHHGFVPS